MISFSFATLIDEDNGTTWLQLLFNRPRQNIMQARGEHGLAVEQALVRPEIRLQTFGWWVVQGNDQTERQKKKDPTCAFPRGGKAARTDRVF